VLKDTYDHSCYWARLDEYWHLMTDSPVATAGRRALLPRHPAAAGAGGLRHRGPGSPAGVRLGPLARP
jgi:hypothetical protein